MSAGSVEGGRAESTAGGRRGACRQTSGSSRVANTSRKRSSLVSALRGSPTSIEHISSRAEEMEEGKKRGGVLGGRGAMC